LRIKSNYSAFYLELPTDLVRAETTPMIGWTLLSFGTILNFIVILVWTFDKKKYRTSSSLFLFHMTIADLLICFFILVKLKPDIFGMNLCGADMAVKVAASIGKCF